MAHFINNFQTGQAFLYLVNGQTRSLKSLNNNNNYFCENFIRTLKFYSFFKLLGNLKIYV